MKLDKGLKQNWPRMITEFVVIMSGILAALAADSAMESYSERQTTREILQALREDISADARTMNLYFAPQLLQQQESRQRLEEFLKSTDPVDDSLEFVDDVLAISKYHTFDPHTMALEDLISTGSLRLIKDAELRRALLSYRAKINNIAEFDTLHRAYFLELHGDFVSRLIGGLAIPYSLDAKSGNIPEDIARSEATAAIDEEAIRSSDMLRRLLVNTIQPQRLKQHNYLNLRDKADELIAMISVTLDSL